MTLAKCWQETLLAKLTSLRKAEHDPRLAVLGVGHELYGDDAVGVWLAGRLIELNRTRPNLLAVQGGPAPENFTGTLRRFKPDMVLLIDAALMDLTPGEIGWLDWRDTSGFSASTHTLPLHLLAAYLTEELNCEVDLLGIQPAACQVGEPLTAVVQTSAEGMAQEISKILVNCSNSH